MRPKNDDESISGITPFTPTDTVESRLRQADASSTCCLRAIDGDRVFRRSHAEMPSETPLKSQAVSRSDSILPIFRYPRETVRKKREATIVKRDLAKIGRKVLLQVIKEQYGNSRAKMAKKKNIPQTTLNDYARTGKGGLRTLSLICSKDSGFFNAFVGELAGEPNEDASWNRIARDLREILSLQEALDMVDSCQTLAEYESASNAVKVLREAVILAEKGYKSGRTHPLVSVAAEKTPDETGS